MKWTRVHEILTIRDVCLYLAGEGSGVDDDLADLLVIQGEHPRSQSVKLHLDHRQGVAGREVSLFAQMFEFGAIKLRQIKEGLLKILMPNRG